MISHLEYGFRCSAYQDILDRIDELNRYLTMNRDDLEKLTPSDCGEIAYRLSQFVFHLQRTINREIARYNWAEEEIKITIYNIEYFIDENHNIVAEINGIDLSNITFQHVSSSLSGSAS